MYTSEQRKSTIQNSLNIIISILFVGVCLIPNFFLRGNSYSITVALGSIIMLSFFCVNYEKKAYKKSNIKNIYLILFTVFGGSFLFNGFYFGTTAYIVIGITFLVVIPVINIMISSKQNVKIYECIAKGIVISFCIFILLSILYGPVLNTNQYASFLDNPNKLGYYMIVVIASLEYIIMKKKRKLKYIILLCCAISILIFSNSRTSIIAVFIGSYFYIIVQLHNYKINHRQLSYKHMLKQSLKIVILFCICFVMIFFILTDVKEMVQESLEKVKLTDSVKTETIEKVTLSENITIVESRLSKGVKNKKDDFTSGRIGIWKDYLENLRWLGHEKEERAINSDGRIYEGTNAHNTYLQVAYSAGILAGLALLSIMILVAVNLLIKFYKTIKNKESIKSEFVLGTCISIGFVVVSITASTYMPYTYILSTIFWIMIHPIIMKASDL